MNLDQIVVGPLGGAWLATCPRCGVPDERVAVLDTQAAASVGRSMEQAVNRVREHLELVHGLSTEEAAGVPWLDISTVVEAALKLSADPEALVQLEAAGELAATEEDVRDELGR